ncbi:AAA family ATPase [Aureimonas sp. Leaf324]|uniref:AAA family ATPase n=1 Tax=Aureimonas sp. Leaf324 TaxID=1736336 RepID=UPI0006FF4CA2|nr:AAA family ATPase [Aureimonas sp. Leaf324]KQQ91038.1 hypothetical protein ASF65_00420 [Aureimonas sp. Leaf324]
MSSDAASLYDVLISQTQIYDESLQPVLAGKEYAALDFLLKGGPPADGSIMTDFSLWAENIRRRRLLSEDGELRLLIACTNLPTRAILRDLRDHMPAGNERQRVDYWLAVHGDLDAANELYRRYHQSVDLRAAFVLGLEKHAKSIARNHAWSWHPGIEIKILIRGAAELATRIALQVGAVSAVCDWREAIKRPSAQEEHAAAEKAWLRDLVTIARTKAYEREIEKTRTVDVEAEDYVGPDDPNRYCRAGSGLLWDDHLGVVVDESSDEPPEERTARIHAHVAQVTAEREAARPDRPTAAYPYLVVLADLELSEGGRKAPGGDNELVRHLGAISGRHIELACAPDNVFGIAGRLGDAWPHAREAIDRILRDVLPGEPIRFRPTLLVGKPGSGKTSLAREIGTALGLHTTVYPCASVSDNSFGGTPMQWGTRRASTPLEAIRAANLANPVLVLDEIEKTGSGGNHGSLLTSLLPMLERHTASAYFEVGIERPSDLSFVSFIATANSLVDVPAPLLDRFRVIEMPDAGPEHLGDLARRIVADIAIDDGLDPAWTPALAYDELAVIRRMWKGGSLRRLRTAIQATLDARETVLRGRPM